MHRASSSTPSSSSFPTTPFALKWECKRVPFTVENAVFRMLCTHGYGALSDSLKAWLSETLADRYNSKMSVEQASSLIGQMNQLRVMWNHNKVLQKAPEVVARHKRGESILNISFVREFPPIAVFKAFLQARDNLTKARMKVLFRNPETTMRAADFAEYQSLLEHDVASRQLPDTADNARHFEEALEDFFRSHSLEFRTEGDARHDFGQRLREEREKRAAHTTQAEKEGPAPTHLIFDENDEAHPLTSTSENVPCNNNNHHNNNNSNNNGNDADQQQPTTGPTPDLLFAEPIVINNRKVNWIEAKNFYGTARCKLHHEKIQKQVKTYYAAFGPGAICFSLGFCENYTLPHDTLILDGTNLSPLSPASLRLPHLLPQHISAHASSSSSASSSPVPPLSASARKPPTGTPPSRQTPPSTHTAQQQQQAHSQLVPPPTKGATKKPSKLPASEPHLHPDVAADRDENLFVQSQSHTVPAVSPCTEGRTADAKQKKAQGSTQAASKKRGRDAAAGGVAQEDRGNRKEKEKRTPQMKRKRDDETEVSVENVAGEGRSEGERKKRKKHRSSKQGTEQAAA